MIELLKQLAPTVASAFLGPLGGMAVTALGSILGLSDATTKGVADAFRDGKLSPEQLTQIKALEIDFQAKEKELGFRFAELEFKDRDSARKLQSDTKSITPSILSYCITGGFFGVLTYMLFDPNMLASPPLLIMLGSLGTAWASVVGFWFGTTHNSGQKDILLSNSVPNRRV